MNTSFWRGKKVFLTGHTGFKGAWLTAVLCELGADVTGYALAPPTNPSLFDLLGLEKSIHHIEGDIRDGRKLTAAMQAAKPDIALHLAAQALVRKSYAAPVETFDVNIMGTVNFLDAVSRTGDVKSVVVVTSDKCYKNNDTGRFFTEEDPMGGHDPYSSSKGAAELVAQSWYDSFFSKAGTPMATARAGNVIGGGDWALDRLIPDAFRAFEKGLSVVIRNPHATRPWQHVLEPVRGYMLLAQKLFEQGAAFTGGWNFGPHAESIRSVEHVLTQLQKTLPVKVQFDTVPQPHEAKTLGLDINKAVSVLDWKPELDLMGSVMLTGQWYREYAATGQAKDITLAQIRGYFGLEQEAQRKASAA